MQARMPSGSREDSQDEGSGSHLRHAQAEQASLQSACCGRFAALATDDTESIGHNSDDCAVEVTTGCREFLPRRRRRLRITWQDREPTTCAPTQVEPDSHEERLARVRQLVRQPRQRMAPGFRQRHRYSVILPKEWVPWIRKAIRRQHWSAVFVPLMWAAACGDRECPLLQWLGHASSGGIPHHCRRG